MIGLIFGETEFPKYILKKIKKKSKYLIIDLTKKKIFKKERNSYSVSVGQFGKIISILKSNNCKKVLFAGKVTKPNFKSIKLDLKGIYYIPKIIKSSKLGDAAILKQIINILKKEKIQTVSSNKFTPEISLPKGNYTTIYPNIYDKKDISCGEKALKKSGNFSFIQGVICRNNRVVAYEGNGGTQKMIKKVKRKSKYLIIDLTKKKVFKKDRNSYAVSIGQFGKIISILKSNNCKKVLFAGKVTKPNFKSIKLDFKGIYYMPKIIKSSKLGDAAILKQIINILKKEKIQTVSSNTFTPEISLPKGNYTLIKPNIFDKKDIRFGEKALKKSGNFSFVQGAICRDNKIVALEGSGGTQKMIKKVKKINRLPSGILIKFPKKRQDLRVDLPTIGLETLKQCKSVGLKGIVLKNRLNIFLDKERSIKYANQNKMFIFVK